jgi:heme oxygenase
VTAGLLAELRTATRAAHDRLESRLDVLSRCRTTTEYAALLAGFRSVYAPLEQALDRSPLTTAAVPDWPQRRKTGWLDADLRELGAPTPVLPAGPAPASEAEVLGAVYVMEGATLGGALVVRSLRAAFLDPPPHRFFASYGARRGAMWAAFRRSAERHRADPADAVESALRTFAAVERACVAPAAGTAA